MAHKSPGLKGDVVGRGWPQRCWAEATAFEIGPILTIGQGFYGVYTR
jgi:hypothetical protein